MVCFLNFTVINRGKCNQIQPELERSKTTMRIWNSQEGHDAGRIGLEEKKFLKPCDI